MPFWALSLAVLVLDQMTKALVIRWVPMYDNRIVVPGLGDTAYYVDNGGRWGQLYVTAAGRVLTIQMAIPMGRTAASIQPNVIALAKAILPKLT